ncbi:MAG: hypothetical protein H8E14_17345 [Candidatus Marinimicrobia bacterium]|nr:hypothetical protein [Candidatus Neomarinimicrobiota bacterium]
MKIIARRSFNKSLILFVSGFISRLGARESFHILDAIPNNQDTAIPPDRNLKIEVFTIGDTGEKVIKSLGEMNLRGVNVTLINDSILYNFPVSIHHADLVCILAEVNDLQALKTAMESSRKENDQDILSVGILINHDLDDYRALDIQKSDAFDSLILIPNTSVEANIGLIVKTFLDCISKNNLISIDNEDLEFYLKNSGIGYISTGIASGKDRAKLASQIALNNLRHHLFGLNKTDNFLINVSGPENMALYEIDQGVGLFFNEASRDANILFTATIDPGLNDAIRVTVFRLWSS